MITVLARVAFELVYVVLFTVECVQRFFLVFGCPVAPHQRRGDRAGGEHRQPLRARHRGMKDGVCSKKGLVNDLTYVTSIAFFPNWHLIHLSQIFMAHRKWYCLWFICFSPQVILLLAQSEAYEFVLADTRDVSVVNAQKLNLGSHGSASALFAIRPVALGVMEVSMDAVSAEASDSLVWTVLVKVRYNGRLDNIYELSVRRRILVLWRRSCWLFFWQTSR